VLRLFPRLAESDGATILEPKGQLLTSSIYPDMQLGILAMLLATGALPLGGHTPPACGQPGDTLRYRELTQSELTLYSSAGTRLLDQTYDALVALVFGPGDSVTAWYDTLSLEVQSVNGAQRPATGALLRQLFQLRCDGRGRLATLRAPAVPQEIREITDLSQEFIDFLVRIPATTMGRGVEWTDTLAHVVPDAGGVFRRYTSLTTWAVEKDTLIAGGRGWILKGRSKLNLEAGDLVSDRSGQAVSVLTGEELGRVVLTQDGRLLSRTKQGRLAGQLTLGSGSSARSFPQDYTYDSRITHVP
jgi:hypothetical protein